MSLAARIQALFQERRREERTRVLTPAHCRIEDETVAAVLLNLSRTGAMLASVSPPRERAGVTLICEGLSAPGRVVWQKGYQFGIAFDRELDQRQHAAILALGAGKGDGR
jgi:hypothetical protein